MYTVYFDQEITHHSVIFVTLIMYNLSSWLQLRVYPCRCVLKNDHTNVNL